MGGRGCVEVIPGEEGTPMLTVREVADHLRVSPSCVYGLIGRGLLACHRIGLGRGTIRVTAEQLARFLDRATAGARRLYPPPVRDIE